MPSEILMPALSPTMVEGKLAKWLVREGDSVRAGDVVAEIETDKATMEVEAVDEGRVGKILVQEGAENIAVNTPIALLLADGEDAGDPVQTGIGARERAVSPIPSPAPRGERGRESVNPSSAFASSGEENGEAGGDPGVRLVKLTVREALRSAIAEEMRRDDAVFLMGEEVAEYQGAYKVSEGLLQEFGPRRVVDTPITEAGFAGLGVGAAMAGLKPIVEFMTFNFSMQAVDQIVNSAAKSHYMSGGQVVCSIVFRGPNGPAARVGAQHSQEYSAWYSHVPGLKVIHPYTAADAKGLLKAAIRDPNPVVFLENEILYGHSFMVPDTEDWLVPIGKARIARSGSDVTIVSWGIGMSYATQASDQLSASGIEAELVDMRTLRPMDEETVVRSVMKTGRLVCVEEGWPRCSVSSELCALVSEQAFDYLDAPPVRITCKDVPMPYAANLEKLMRPSAADIVAAARAVCYRS